MSHTILVVEDNPITRKLFRITLESEDYVVLEAPDGKTALEHARTGHPDLIIQDLLLPDIHGVELKKQLREMPETAHIPIIAATGLLSKLDEARAINGNFTDYLLKPIEPSKLLEMVDRHLPAYGAKPAKLGDKQKILLVDDDPVGLKLQKALLEEQGFEVSTAEDGAEAFAKASKSRPDAILTDLIMPRLNGFDLTMKIRNDRRLKNIPVVVTSSTFLLIEEDDIKTARALGATTFVVRTPKLEGAIEALLTAFKHKKRAPKPKKDAPSLLRQVNHRFIRQLEAQAAQRTKEIRRSTLENARLSVLTGVAEVLNRKLDLGTAIQEALTRTLDASGVSVGAIYLAGEDGTLRLEASLGVTKDENQRLPDLFGHRELLEQTFREGKAIVVPSPAVKPEQIKGLLEQGFARSLVLIPLIAGDAPQGVLLLASTHRELVEDWADLAGAIGIQLAQAALLSRTHVQLSGSEKRIRALHEIDLAITSTLDLRSVLTILLEKVDLSFPYPSVSTIRLLNKKTGALDAITCRNIDEEGWKKPENHGDMTLRAHTVMETRAPFIVRNLLTDLSTQKPDDYMMRGMVSYLGVPLIAHDQVLGVLSFYTKEEHEFSNEEIEFLTTLADQAAIAINNAQLYESVNSSRKELELTNQYLGKSLKELSGLYAALSPLAPSESVHEMMDGIIERLIKATGADAAQVRFWDNTSGRFVRASQRGFPDSYFRSEGTRGTGGAADWVFKTGEPVIASDITTDPRLKTKVQPEAGFYSCAMLPLKVHDEVRGIIHLASRKRGYFDEEQKDQLMAIGRQMEIAMENKEMVDNLQKSRDELEKANKIKDEFLSVMSHELRTPLNVVMGYTGMIKDGLLGEINPQQKEALEKVINRANDQLVLINNILYATVLETEKIKVESHTVVLGDFFKQLSSAHETPLNKQLTLNWDCPSPLAVVHTDSAKLKHILQNLIGNALKFTAKGSVTISAQIRQQARGNRQQMEDRHEATGERQQEEGLLTPRAFVEFKVADTGVGIPKEYLPFVFDKFRQVDSSETRHFGGVGMGLYIVKKFTELLGGTVEVESEVEKGTTFTVTLPCG